MGKITVEVAAAIDSNSTRFTEASRTAQCEKSVAYRGYSYAALDVTVEPRSNDTFCQDSYLSLPAGWRIAPDDTDSIRVAASFPWGTHVMVLEGGAQYYTSHSDWASYAGEPNVWYCCIDGLTALGQSSSGYRVNSCARRILLKYTGGLCCTDVSSCIFLNFLNFLF